MSKENNKENNNNKPKNQNNKPKNQNNNKPKENKNNKNKNNKVDKKENIKKPEVKEEIKKKIKEEKIEEPKVEEKKEEVKEEVKVEEPKEEKVTSLDVQTTSAKDSKLKKGNKFLFPCIMAGIVIVLFIALFSLSSPKGVFKRQIKNIYTISDKYLDIYDEKIKKYNVIQKPFTFTTEFKLDTSDEDIKDYKVKYEFDSNIKDSYYANKVNLTKGKDNIEGSFYLVDNKAYLDSSLLDDPIDVTYYYDTEYYFDVVESYIFGGNSLYETLDNINTDDYRYIIKTLTNEFAKTLDSSAFSSETKKLNLDDKTVRVKKITYSMDEDLIQETIEQMVDNLKDNDKFLSTVARAFDLDKSDVKDFLKELKEEAEEIELDDPIDLCIYTKGALDDLVGYGIEMDDDEYLTIFIYDGYYEFTYDDHGEYYREKYSIIGTTDDDGVIKFVVKEDGDKIATIKVNKNTDEELDITYEVPDEDVEGHIYFSLKEQKNKITGKYIIDTKDDYYDEYYKLEGSYTLEIKNELSKFNTENVIDYDKINFKNIKDKISKINDDYLRDELDDFVSELEAETLDLNYIGMFETDYEDATLFIERKQTGMIYIGDTYYEPYYYEDESEEFELEEKASDFLDYIEELQDEYDFHSYYLDDYDSYSKCSSYNGGGRKNDTVKCMEVSFEEYLKSTSTCGEDAECIYNKLDSKQRPVWYAIKDGVLVAILTPDSTEEEMLTALKLVGIDT